MKMLIVVEHSPKQRFLVSLHTKELAKEVKRLIDRKRHSQAIVTALSKGRFEREVEYSELPTIEADLILSENNVSWDITK